MNNKIKPIIFACSFILIAGAAITSIVLLSNHYKTNYSFNYYRLVFGSQVKTKYYVGDNFEEPSLRLINNENNADVLMDDKYLSFSGYDLSKTGNYTVLVNYDDGNAKASTNYNINVYSSKVIDLDISCSQDKLVWGEKINRKNIVCNAIFDDQHVEKIEDYKLHYNNCPEDYGIVEVSLTYQEITKTFFIEVIETKISEEYSELENEAKRILNAFGIDNPSSPKNYLLDYYVNGKAKISFKGELIGNYSEDEIYSLFGNLFNEYTLSGDIVDTYEIILPSKKAVFLNQIKNIQVTTYVCIIPEKVIYYIVIEYIDA